MRRVALFLVSLAFPFLLGIPFCHAQEDRVPPQPEQAAEAHIARGLQLAAAADTIAALAALRQAVETAPKLAEAHFQLGRLLAEHSSFIETEFRERLAAESELREALLLDIENPRYLAELGRLFVKQQMRVDGERLLKRALDKAERLGLADPRLLAEVHFALGWIQEVRYERQRDRRMVGPLRGDISASVPPNASPWFIHYVDNYLESAPPIERSGEDARHRMLDHYARALRHDPTYLQAGIRQLAPLLDENRLDDYSEILRTLQTAHPDRPKLDLYDGLRLHVAGRETEAGAAFEQALAGLPESDRQALLGLQPILRREQARNYLTQDDSTRARSEAAFWQLTDPLYITDWNERQLEHMARVAYADLRFAEPSTGRRGWETDRGVIFIRYGPPTEIARTSTARGQRIVWRYGSAGPVFMFDQQPGYFRARFAGDYRWVADETRQLVPAWYDNIVSIAAMSPIPMQVARFRGGSADWIAVEVTYGAAAGEAGREPRYRVRRDRDRHLSPELGGR